MGLLKCFFIQVMTQYNSSLAAPSPNSVNWTWFFIGCGCLALGSVYLNSVDLSSDLSAAEVPTIEQAAEPEAISAQRL